MLFTAKDFIMNRHFNFNAKLSYYIVKNNNILVYICGKFYSNLSKITQKGLFYKALLV